MKDQSPRAASQAETSDKIRDAVLEAFNRIAGDGWTHVHEHVAYVFREFEMGHRAKGRAVHTLYGMMAHLRRLEFAVQRAPRRSLNEVRDEGLDIYLAFLILEGQITPDIAKEAAPGLDWIAVSQSSIAIDATEDPVVRFGLQHSLPDWLAKKLMEQYGEEAPALCAALNRRPPQMVRTNTLKQTREGLIRRLSGDRVIGKPAALSPQGVEIDPPVELFSLEPYHKGQFEIQDEASQLVAEITAPSPGSLVIDACAGAGGKTLALGALMKNRGRLIALDIHAGRLEELRRRARRAELSNVQALEIKSATAILEKFIGKADRVLVDAPCSGMGALRRNPESKWRMVKGDLERFPQQQFDIANDALRFVKPGGRLIYATCTLFREENEEIVARITESGEFSAVPLKEVVGKALAEKISDASGLAMKLLPHTSGTDGFFAAVLRRKKSVPEKTG